MTDTKPISGHGTINVYVDGVFIGGIKNTFPIPDMTTKSAFLNYIILKNDPGQIIIDVSAHKEDETHEFKIILSDYYTWVYDGMISNYKLDSGSPVEATVKIVLCGKFKYCCGTQEVNRVFALNEVTEKANTLNK
jgi:hypothetical protein